MASDEALRQHLVQEAIARRMGSVPNVAVQLWRPLALHLVAIVGENGFNSLYARSRYLTNESFPWLAPGDASRPIDFQFADLKISLEGQDPLEADKASRALLQTFINNLASLIGEPVMIHIVSSAWADNVSERETAGKEFPNG